MHATFAHTYEQTPREQSNQQTNRPTIQPNQQTERPIETKRFDILLHFHNEKKSSSTSKIYYKCFQNFIQKRISLAFYLCSISICLSVSHCQYQWHRQRRYKCQCHSQIKRNRDKVAFFVFVSCVVRTRACHYVTSNDVTVCRACISLFVIQTLSSHFSIAFPDIQKIYL